MQDKALEYQASADRYYRRLGEEVDRLSIEMFKGVETDGVVVYEVNVRPPKRNGDPYLAVIKGQSDSVGHVVAFASGASFADALLEAGKRVRMKVAVWKLDAYQKE